MGLADRAERDLERFEAVIGRFDAESPALIPEPFIEIIEPEARARIDLEDSRLELDRDSIEACGVTPAAAATRRFDRQGALIGDALEVSPDPPEQIVHGYMPRNVGVKVGVGGVGKSTHDLFEALHIILGDRPLYGFEILRPGPVLILSAEDERDVVRWRLHRIAQDMGLCAERRAFVARHLHIEDVTGFPARIVDVDSGGRLVRTKVLDELVEEYKGIRLSAIFADPQNAFGPGERFVNDGEAELMRAGAWLSRTLECAVRFDHHTGKASGRAGHTDQYAGRGGSAGADNARFVHLLVQHSQDGEGLTAPQDASGEDMAQGRLVRLHVAKLSHGQRPAAPVWLLRRGFTFEHLQPKRTDPDLVERERIRRVCEYIGHQGRDGIRHSRSTLEDVLEPLQLSRSELRATLHVAIERGYLVERELPKAEQRGARKTYLTLGGAA